MNRFEITNQLFEPVRYNHQYVCKDAGLLSEPNLWKTFIDLYDHFSRSDLTNLSVSTYSPVSPSRIAFSKAMSSISARVSFRVLRPNLRAIPSISFISDFLFPVRIKVSIFQVNMNGTNLHNNNDLPGFQV